MQGKYTTSHGYVMIKVPAGHHLAMTRGYAYEHRVVAEQKLGRRLEPNEHIHHVNEDKTDNRPENLEVYSGNAEHRAHHRIDPTRRWPGEENPTIECACGCGGTLLKFYKSGRARKYLPYHNGVVSWTKNPSPRLNAVLAYLRTNGPSRVGPIAKHTGENPAYVATCLLQLRLRGVVDSDNTKLPGYVWYIVKDRHTLS